MWGFFQSLESQMLARGWLGLLLGEDLVQPLNTDSSPENLWWVVLDHQPNSHTAAHSLPSPVGCIENRMKVRRHVG